MTESKQARTSILSHIALQFAKHPENLATEGLAYVLASSKIAGKALSKLLSQLCAETGQHELDFATQSTNEDGGRPDLIGTDQSGRSRLFIEVKFWAALTDRQPVAYLRELQSPGVLLFVAPERRCTLIWQEIESRLESVGWAQSEIESSFGRAAAVEGKTIALVSWRLLLERLYDALDAEGEAMRASDVKQLAALCDRMDSEAFVPFLAEDLNPTIGTRVLEFCQLVDDVTGSLVNSNISNTTGLRATGGRGWYGRYQLLGGTGAFLHFSPDAWSEWGKSPIWLTLKAPTDGVWATDPTIATTLRLNGVYCESDGDGCHVPLEVVRGKEWHELTSHVSAQCRAIAETLKAR